MKQRSLQRRLLAGSPSLGCNVYIDNLSTLLRTGPGLGVTTVLGVHDLGLLKETYGQHAEGVLSMCGHFALLRTNSRETARWASELLGEQTIRFRRKSTTEQATDESDKPPKISTTVSEHDDNRYPWSRCISVEELVAFEESSEA